MAQLRSHFALGVPSRVPPAMAALDLGTNNCRLLVARPVGQGFAIVDSFSRIVRLGEAVARTGRLSERAIARTMAALRVCARIVARHEVGPIRCVATEACRRAHNGVEFLDAGRAGDRAPLRDPARMRTRRRLALLGCLPLIDPAAEHVLLVDIGGGSTELLWLDRSQAGGQAMVRCSHSVAIGVVALSEAFAAEPDPSTFEVMVRHVQDLLAPIEAQHAIGRHLAGRRSQMLGTSGTVTTLAALHLDLRALRPPPDRRPRSRGRRRSSTVSGRLRADDQRRARGAPLHRTRPGRSRGRRLRDPRGGLAQLADRPAAGRRSRPARGHPAGPDGPLAGAGADRPGRDGAAARAGAAGAGRGHAAVRARPPSETTPMAPPRATKVRLRPSKGRRASSSRWLERHINDRFVQGARAAGYRSRAAYKLLEIDARVRAPAAGPPRDRSRQRARRLGRRWRPPGARAWPASICRRWSRSRARPCSRATSSIRRRSRGCSTLAGGPVELVLSDLAAAATGQRAVDRLRADGLAEAVLTLLPELLAPGGDAGRQAVARRRGRDRRRRPAAVRAHAADPA